MFTVSAETSAIPRASRALDALSTAMRDMRPLWELVSADLTAVEAERWKTKGASRGTPWAELGPRYGALKRWHFGDLPLLVLTGALRRALTERNAPGGVRRMTQDMFTFGTSLEYAERVQAGTTEDRFIGPPFNITIHGHPGRTILDVQSGDESRWNGLAVRWAEDVARRVARSV